MVRAFIAGVVLATLFVGCAGFAFHYYGLEGATYKDGKLLGAKPEDDLPFTRCEPTTADLHPCVVMLVKEFYAFKADYEDTKTKLKACEQQLPYRVEAPQ